MERNELYCHYFCRYINNKLHIHDMGSPDYVYSDNLDELKENYFNDFIGYQTDGLYRQNVLHPIMKYPYISITMVEHIRIFLYIMLFWKM